MTDFATGVQRWCSCLDYRAMTRTRAGFCLPAEDFCRFASGFDYFARGSNAVGQRHGQPQRFRSPMSPDMTAKAL